MVPYNGNYVINGKLYNLNNSRTKFVNIGLALDNDYCPCIEIGAKAGVSIILNEDDWKQLLQHQGTISSYFFSIGYFDIPIRFNNFTIYFDKIDDYNIIKIKHDDNRYIYLGCESTCKLWEMIPLIEYRLEMLKKQQFDRYFNGFKSNVLGQQGDLIPNVLHTLAPKQNPHNENVSTMMEMLAIYPDILEYKLKCHNRRVYYDEISKV